jgi:hypothetical protein
VRWGFIRFAKQAVIGAKTQKDAGGFAGDIPSRLFRAAAAWRVRVFTACGAAREPAWWDGRTWREESGRKKKKRLCGCLALFACFGCALRLIRRTKTYIDYGTVCARHPPDAHRIARRALACAHRHTIFFQAACRRRQ